MAVIQIEGPVLIIGPIAAINARKLRGCRLSIDRRLENVSIMGIGQTPNNVERLCHRRIIRRVQCRRVHRIQSVSGTQIRDTQLGPFAKRQLRARIQSDSANQSGRARDAVDYDITVQREGGPITEYAFSIQNGSKQTDDILSVLACILVTH